MAVSRPGDILMDTLRVLLVDSDSEQSQRIASLLSEGNHTVLPAGGLEEASEALFVQRFDAVLLGSPVRADELSEFKATLRKLEKAQPAPVKIPVLSFSSEAFDVSRLSRSSDPEIDGYLPEHFQAAALTDAVNRLSLAVAHSTERTKLDAPDLPVFEPEQFQAQVCHDSELLVEIIDLFLTESVDQIAEMRQAVASADYERLCRLAHTLKGSLGSLHAAMARSHAQDLETAAKEREEQVCRFSLAALEQDLDTLKPRLLALREFPDSN